MTSPIQFKGALLGLSLIASLAAGCGGSTDSVAPPIVDPDPPSEEAQWRPLGSAILAGRTMLPQIERDPNGDAYCSFQDRTTANSRGSVVRFDSSAVTWRYVGGAGEASRGLDWWGVVQPASGGVIYRANRDYGFSNSGLGLRRYDPSVEAWEPFGNQPLTDGEAHFVDVELDNSGRLLIGFQDGLRTMPNGPGAVGAATVLRVDPTSGNAIALGGAGFSSAFAEPSDVGHVDVEVSSNGTLWAAWTEKGLGGAHPRVARLSAGSETWTLVGSSATGLPIAGAHVAIDLDLAGRPVIAFRGNAPLRFLVYRMDLQQGTWSQIGDDIEPSRLSVGSAPGFSLEQGYRERTPFVVGPAGGMYIAFLSPDDNQVPRVKVFTLSEGAWVPMAGTGFLPGTEQEDYTSLTAIAENGVEVPIIACRRAPQTPNERLIGYAFR